MKFSTFYEEIKKARAFNVEPDEIQALKTSSPRFKKASKGNIDDVLGKKAKKKSKFSAKKKASRSTYDAAIGRRKRKGGKTKTARQILAKKHGIKKAIQKDGNQEYFWDHLHVQEVMKKMGYDWDQDDGSWTNKPERKPIKPKKKRKRKYIPKEDPDRKDLTGLDDEEDTEVAVTNVEQPEDDVPEIKRDGEIIEVDEEDLTQFTIIGAGGVEYDVTEEDLMAYEARLILGLIHGMNSAMDFEESEEVEEKSDIEDGKKVKVITIEPIISREKILDKVEELGYEYWPELDEWKIDGQFPFPNEKTEEDKKSIIGRTYLAAMGFFKVFDFDLEGNPLTFQKENIDKVLQDHGMVWNEKTSTWNKSELDDDEVNE